MRYNDAHTRTRTVIERCFGWLKALHGEIKVFENTLHDDTLVNQN